MSFAVPTALAWAALAVPILILYILKVRLRRVPVSTTIFWRQIFDEKKPRSLWQTLRHLMSLLVQILLLLLLVFALAKPFFSWEASESRRIVLVVDNSASMRAVDASPTRLAAAKASGRDAIGRLRLRDQMAVVAAGTQPRVVCGMTGHQRTLRESLQSVAAGDGPTRVSEAVVLARRLIGDHPNGRVIVLSDGCFEDAQQLAAAEDIEFHCIGLRTGNLGITRFQVRRSFVDSVGYEILVEVVNASDEAVECRLEIDLEEFPVDVIPLKLDAGERWSQTLEKTSQEGGRLVARIDRDDALTTDNQAIVLLPERKRQRVLLVTQGNWFLQKAFEANQLVDLKVVNQPPASYPDDTLVVFHGEAPEKLPPRPVFVVDPANTTDAYEVGGQLNNPIVTDQDEDSELMRHVRLDNVVLPEARQLVVNGQPQVLASALSGDPLYCAVERTNGKLLILTVNLDEGDLTFRTAFPIMVTNALNWFAGPAGDFREAFSSGALVEVELPQSSQVKSTGWFFVRTPSGDDRPLPAGVSETTIGPLDETGIWSVLAGARRGATSGVSGAGVAKADVAEQAAEEPPVLEVACNLTNRAETDLRMAESLLDIQPSADLAAGWLTRPIWFYLIALAWLLAAVEWFLYQRRWIS